DLRCWKILCSFFQAEDCIRARNVPGVQTCALPIYLVLWGRSIENQISNLSKAASLTMQTLKNLERHASSRKELVSRQIQELWNEIGRASCRERGEMAVASG